MPYYVIFRDTRVTGKGGVVALHREILEVLYPRPYRISNNGKVHIQSKHGVTLDEVDFLFENWNGEAFPDFYLTFYGTVRSSQFAPHDVYWFMGKNQKGEQVRVIFSMKDEKSLPFVITVYSPTQANMETLNEVMTGMSPRRLLQQ